ncbi:MAG TPA: hypothetical protein VFU09_12995 [Candidatus Udaeobacter sp.]|nr:hypothetical protein [Candidatus Udaeobacter sp.]
MTYGDFDKRLYAKWSDVVPSVIATVEAVRVEEMPKTKDEAIVLWFPKEEFRYGVPLTAKCNREAMEKITGSKDPMDAVGVTIEMFADMAVPNPRTGERGALRIRAPQSKGKPKKRKLEPDEEEDFPR